VDWDRVPVDWESFEHIAFLDEAHGEQQVHFMHADNMVIGTETMRKCCAFSMPDHEWALIDDYWMSFVLSKELQCMLFKIEASDVFSFTPSADDPAVALYHNAAVKHERFRFYIHHMEQGWPSWE
jgi:hypothetical protein